MSLEENSTGQLSDDIVETMSVQERGGTLQVSLPKDSVLDLGLEKGDTVILTGEAGERALSVRKASASAFADD